MPPLESFFGVSEHVPEPLPKAECLFLLAAKLREGRFSVRELALSLYPTAAVGALGWSGIERAVQRDLLDLERLEPHFTTFRGRPPRYSVSTQRSTLETPELVALHAAARLLHHRSSGNLHTHRQVVKRLNQWLPEQVQSVVQRALGDPGKRRSREDLNVEHAADAWLLGHPLRFEYKKPGGSGAWRVNVVEPYLIEVHPGNLELYLVGLERSFHGDVRTFKLSRMRALQVDQSQTFRVPPDFDPLAFFHSAWGVVGTQAPAETLHLRFAPQAAYRIKEGGYAHLAPLRELPCGSLETSVPAVPDSSGLPREVMAWVLSWGPRVEVLSPLHLREHWLSELRAALACAQ